MQPVALHTIYARAYTIARCKPIDIHLPTGNKQGSGGFGRGLDVNIVGNICGVLTTELELHLDEFLCGGLGNLCSRCNRTREENTIDLLLEQRGLPYSELHRVRRQLAESADFGIGDEALTWISNQLIEMFMRSAWVDEVYVDDATMRRKLKDLLRKHMQHDEDLDREVRRHLKHLNEGTSSFEIEYQKQLELVKRKHGLS